VNRLKGTEPGTRRAGPAARLRVRALTTDRKPLADARVTLVNGEPGLDTSFSWGYHNAGWEGMGRGRTGADGWADFPALSFGAATVVYGCSNRTSDCPVLVVSLASSVEASHISETYLRLTAAPGKLAHIVPWPGAGPLPMIAHALSGTMLFVKTKPRIPGPSRFAIPEA